jgi:hypothetical protein
VIVTDEKGAPLSAPLDIRANVSWAGYANTEASNLIQPHLTALLDDLTKKGTN